MWSLEMDKLFVPNRTVYTENSGEFTDKVLELIRVFSKVTGYKLDTQKAMGWCT